MAGKTAEERITVIDEKIAKKKAEIESLEAQSWAFTGGDCREIRFRGLR